MNWKSLACRQHLGGSARRTRLNPAKSNATTTSKLKSQFSISAVRFSFLLEGLCSLCLYIYYLPSVGNTLKQFKACRNIAVMLAKTNSLLRGFLPYQLSRLNCASFEGGGSPCSSSESAAAGTGLCSCSAEGWASPGLTEESKKPGW